MTLVFYPVVNIGKSINGSRTQQQAQMMLLSKLKVSQK